MNLISFLNINVPFLSYNVGVTSVAQVIFYGPARENVGTLTCILVQQGVSKKSLQLEANSQRPFCNNNKFTFGN